MNLIKLLTVPASTFLTTLLLWIATIDNNTRSFGLPFRDGLTVETIFLALFSAAIIAVLSTIVMNTVIERENR